MKSWSPWAVVTGSTPFPFGQSRSYSAATEEETEIRPESSDFILIQIRNQSRIMNVILILKSESSSES